ncbi:MAG: hypothetical protein L6R48_16485 [Planctomycetes bacterium]|nr:hypothetical protein [Planctomycetota bacterium]
MRRGADGAEAYLSRAYLDLPVQPGGQYLFRCQVHTTGGGSGRLFCSVGDAAGWDERSITWGRQLAPGEPVSALLPVVVPAGMTRIRLCLAAEGASTTSRFSDLSLELAVPPLLLAPATAAAPALDGVLDDPLWRDAPRLAPLRVLGDIGCPAALASEARLALRDGWLWIAVRCTEPDPDRIRAADQDSFAIYGDDCIEVYVSADRVEYSQVVVNAAGRHGWKRFNRPVAGRSWLPVADEGAPGTVESAARIDRTRGEWACEMRLRLADVLGAGAGGRAPLHLNLVRHRPRTAEEYVSWALLPGITNHDPRHFASVILDLPGSVAAAATGAATAAPLRLSPTSRLAVPEVLLGATPVRLVAAGGRFALPARLRVADRVGIDPGVIADIEDAVRCAGGGEAGLDLAIEPAACDDPVLDPAQRARMAGSEAFRLELAGSAIAIRGRTRDGILRGLATLAQIGARARLSARDLPALVLLDAPACPVRGWMLHDSKPIAVTHSSIDLAFRLRLNHLLIAVDSFNGPTGFPFACAPIGDSQRTRQEWIDAFAYARARGIEPIPYISSWSRTQYLTRLPQYHHLMVSDRGLVQAEHRNLDVANPEAQRLMLALQAELIETLRPSALCIAFDEIHYSEMVASAAAKAKGWKPSDWVVEALTVNADFLRGKDVRMWLWGDMLDPGQNGRHLDASGPALLARLPRDMTILDWKYEGAFDSAADFPSMAMFERHGLPTIGCPWYQPGNVAAVAASVRRAGARGMIQTSWNSTNPAGMKSELRRALALTARLSWSPEDGDLARLTTLPEAPVDVAGPRREAALGPPVAQRPLVPADGLLDQAATAALLGWPGSSLDFLTAPLANPRRIVLQPFRRQGLPASLPVDGSAPAISVGAPVRALTFLHATTPRRLVGDMAADAKMTGQEVGAYVVRYADGGSERIVLSYRVNIAAINDPALGREQDAVVFGTLANRYFVNCASHTWINPHPGRAVAAVATVSGAIAGVQAVLLAITAE